MVDIPDEERKRLQDESTLASTDSILLFRELQKRSLQVPTSNHYGHNLDVTEFDFHYCSDCDVYILVRRKDETATDTPSVER